MEKQTDTAPKLETFSMRVKKRRKELKISQDDLACLVWPEIFSDDNMSEKARETKRKCIVGYENGKFPKDPDVYFQLCKALRCDMGYLFGEHDCSTKDLQGVVDYTGLSVDALERLHSYVTNGNAFHSFCADIASDIISDKVFLQNCAQWIRSFYDLPTGEKGALFSVVERTNPEKPYYFMQLEDMKETIKIGLQNEIMRFIDRSYHIDV